jgi:hypothetical protein
VTMVPTTLSFMESVARYSQYIAKGESPSANAAIRLAVVDPAYTSISYPTTLPKVTFEGESTLSDKRYLVVGNYLPRPSDRVVMLPVGHTYVILGAVTLSASPWHEIGAGGEPAFANSWANHGSGFETAGFRKLWDGTIELKGVVSNGTIGTTAFTLPTGYRPALTQSFPSMAGAPTSTTGRITVNTTGTVAVGENNSGTSVTAWMLGHVRFRTT